MPTIDESQKYYIEQKKKQKPKKKNYFVWLHLDLIKIKQTNKQKINEDKN